MEEFFSSDEPGETSVTERSPYERFLDSAQLADIVRTERDPRKAWRAYVAAVPKARRRHLVPPIVLIPAGMVPLMWAVFTLFPELFQLGTFPGSAMYFEPLQFSFELAVGAVGAAAVVWGVRLLRERSHFARAVQELASAGERQEPTARG